MVTSLLIFCTDFLDGLTCGYVLPVRQTLSYPEFKSKKGEALSFRIHHPSLLLIERRSQSREYPADHRHRLLGALSGHSTTDLSAYRTSRASSRR